MRYHFVVDMGSPESMKQMEEQKAFAKACLAGLDEGEAILLTAEKAKVYQQKLSHAKEAIVAIVEDDTPETLLNALQPLICKEDLYLFPGGMQYTQIAVRLGFRTGGSSINGVHGIIIGESGQVSAKRMMYANHMEAVCEPGKKPYFFTLANGMERAQLKEQPFQVRNETFTESASGHIISEERYPEENTGGLEESSVIIAGGRGIGGKSGIEVLERIAQAVGGRVGVSRPAAMNAWAPMNQLIGVSGSMIQPQICIAAGVSGAAAFYAGIEKSKWITAVNKDEKAPIMKMADVAVAEDFVPFMEALEALIKSGS